MALVYDTGAYQTPYNNHLYEYQPLEHPYEHQSHFVPSFKNPFGFHPPAQSRQGLVQVIAPIGLLITLAVTIAVGLYTNYINEQNERRFREAEANSNNNAPPPLVVASVASPPAVATTELLVRAASLFQTDVEGLPVTITPISRQGSVITGKTDENGEFSTTVIVGIPLLVTLSGDGIVTIEQTVIPSATTPPIAIPATSPLDDGTVVAALTWKDAINDLDIAAMAKDCTCLLNFANDCESLSGMLLEDTTLSSGMETLIISGVDAATELLIFANNIEEEPDFAATGAVMTVIVGETAVTASIPTSDPNPLSLFWVAGELTGLEFVPMESDSLKTVELGICQQELIDPNFGGI